MDMFTGDLVDNRTSTQKRKAKEQEGPRQAEMFSQREMAQFGVRANPKLPISPKTRLELMIEDHRTEEEKAEAIQQEALKRNYRLFEEEPNPIPGETVPASEPPTEPLG
jgi:hypothetical protein